MLWLLKPYNYNSIAMWTGPKLIYIRNITLETIIYILCIGWSFYSPDWALHYWDS